jgi:YYY domain-containing protein
MGFNSGMDEPKNTPSEYLETRIVKTTVTITFLFLIMVVAVYLRFVGINWDDRTHPHPDERFLTMVETGISLPSGYGEYFDTEFSPLNPNNAGFGFFVYGTFPIFLVRYLAEWISQTGYDQVHIIGRLASASFDVISVLLVFLIGTSLYRIRVGLLAAAFAAVSVLTIQHAHFFVVDPFANTFILLGIYFAVQAFKSGRWWNYLLFGAALGLATASKVNAAPLAVVLFLAVVFRILKADSEHRMDSALRGFLGLAFAASISILVFRIFQPYAFEGPSFFGIFPNDQFFSNLIEVRRQQTGAADFPPALQWAMRTPFLFSLKNLIMWGLGFPLGIVSWLGCGWAAYRIIRYREFKHIMLVAWTVTYFLWQSSGFTQTMRYQIPIYPTLVILGAWGLWQAWDSTAQLAQGLKQNAAKITVGLTIALVLGGTAFYAFSFVNIYQQPHTQVEASRWIYRNIPGSFNFVLESEGEEFFEPGILPSRSVLHPGDQGELNLVFKPNVWGRLSNIQINIAQESPGVGESAVIVMELFDDLEGINLLASAQYDGFVPSGSLEISFEPDPTLDLSSGHEYMLRVAMIEGNLIQFNDQLWARLETDGEIQNIRVPLPGDFALIEGVGYQTQLESKSSGNLRALYLPYALGLISQTTSIHLEIELLDPSEDNALLAAANLEEDVSNSSESGFYLNFDRPVQINRGQKYALRFNLLEGTGIKLRGSRITNETTWDLGLPFSLDGRSGFNGLYTGFNQELYWPDDEDQNNNEVSDKLERIVRTLSEGDFLTIATNRQYGTTTRVPTRYPLTSAYYRALFGCHWPDEVLECAARAQPDEITGELGYELVAVYQSNPQFAGIEINDQLAEEAFTVYDHPKVLIFQKTSSFSPELVWDQLGDVDVSDVDNVAPKDLTSIPSNIQFVDEDFQGQTGEGTWSSLYNRDSLINRYPFLTIVFWWLAIGLLGIVLFPITRIVFRGLYDSGYPFAKLFALLILSYGTWIGGNIGISFERLEILIILLVIVLVSAALAWRDRGALLQFIKENRKTIIWTEVFTFAFFAIDLGIRLGNPDLWHPFKGGEKPMDFSYLNAVLKSTSFPPYDPWFAGGYINYYYYGFVLVGVPIKLLGVVPSTAYNLLIPTLFSMLAAGAYSIGYNLYLGIRRVEIEQLKRAARIAGVVAAIALIILGNFGTARLMYEEFQELGDPEGLNQFGFLNGPVNALKGVSEFVFSDGRLNISVDRWYWDPSRAIEPGSGEAGPITEFPFFTFLYGDLHAHMINLPLTVAALGWGISWIYGAQRNGKRSLFTSTISILMGGLILGALVPTNTWDFPTYWTLLGIATFVAPFLRDKNISLGNAVEAIASTVALIGFASLLFQPYSLWYQQEYSTADRWFGSQTGFKDYLTAHGGFAILILTWYLLETKKWMSQTPISALRRYQQPILLLVGVSFIFLFLIAILTFQGFGGAPIAFMILFWSGLLIIRRNFAVEKRIVLFLIGTASALTILVEYVVLRGDISRMNTVFKFYLQVWTLLSLSAAAATVWIYADIGHWRKLWRNVWLSIAAVVVFLAALYPLTATPAKISDRMSDSAPASLDGMTYMETSSYYDISGPMDLDEDYRAIRWVQENVDGTPVIVEANTPEYRWGSRFTIYTGLPGVLGWNWHQRQQRGSSSSPSVVERANDIAAFYTNPSVEDAIEFLDRYNVNYIIVGRLERQYYEMVQPCWPDTQGEGVVCDLNGRPMGMQDPVVDPSDCDPVDSTSDSEDLVCPTFGLEKFERMEVMGNLDVVYQDGATAIYEVLK